MQRQEASDIKFLQDAARYFRNRPTNGEDRAHWAHVYNAENLERIAKKLMHCIDGTQVPLGLAWSLNVDGGQCQALIFKDGDGVIGRGDAETPDLAMRIAVEEARNSLVCDESRMTDD